MLIRQSLSNLSVEFLSVEPSVIFIHPRVLIRNSSVTCLYQGEKGHWWKLWLLLVIKPDSLKIVETLSIINKQIRVTPSNLSLARSLKQQLLIFKSSFQKNGATAQCSVWKFENLLGYSNSKLFVTDCSKVSFLFSSSQWGVCKRAVTALSGNDKVHEVCCLNYVLNHLSRHFVDCCHKLCS